jgi:thioester reductase-like protein
MRPLNVLVTGAAGLVGAEVSARLVRAGHAVTALVHRRDELVRNNGQPLRAGTLVPLTGDVTLPDLGLTRPSRDALAAGTDMIVHCAAVTDFGRSERIYQAVNVAGTAHVLDLARRASLPVVHVSTAYVCGERDGVATEEELDVRQRFGNAYEHSKLHAETLVRKAGADGLAVAVVRPTMVVGAERTGVVRDFKNVYIMLKLLAEGRVRTVPGHYDATLDLVPVDHVAEVAAQVATRFDEAVGQTFHAVGRTLTLREVSDVFAEYPSFYVPRVVPPATFDAATLPATELRYHRTVVTLYESYLRRRIRFDDTATARFSPHKLVTGGRAYLRRLIDYALKVNYLGAGPGGVNRE